jgi:uncharacterized protein
MLEQAPGYCSGIVIIRERETNMRLSHFNIVSPIAGTEQFYIVNLLSGHADVLDASEAKQLTNPGGEFTEESIAKGYVVEPDEEARRYRKAYLDFVDRRDTDEIQLFYVPGYACNFDCSYCYQKSYVTPKEPEQQAVLAAFFAYVDREFSRRKKYVTLFGGEPLLPNESSRRVVEAIVAGTNERDLDLAVVTNGYHIARYIDVLAQGRIREIQVTIDGPKAIHDGRRHLVSGGATFDAVVAGVDAALASGMAVNLRTVIDRDNLPAYVELARFAIDRGWTDHPKFKTQIGRNYELHECQIGSARLYSRLELHQDLYRLALEHPDLLRFHRPAFSIARYLSDQGKLPSPLFDACPGTKTEWAFDYTGNIYSCTATVGKAEESLGTFYPDVRLNSEKVDCWVERDVLSIPQCKSCELQLACGGGCGSVAKNRNGTVNAPDCRPVRELIGLGIGFYGKRAQSSATQQPSGGEDSQ